MIIYHAFGFVWAFEVRDYWGISNVALPDGVHAYINEGGDIEIMYPCSIFPYLSFFMPWFFYKSGQFFKKRERRELLTKDARKLLLTFAIWSAIGYALFLLLGILQHSLTLRSATYSVARGFLLAGKIPINEPLWFLLTLFGVRFVANSVLPKREDKHGWWKIGAIVLICYLLAYVCFRWNHRLLPYWVANSASGLSFFALGYGVRDYENKWWLVLPCAMIYVICCFLGFPMVDMMYNTSVSGSYLLWMPTALSGIIVFNAICTWVNRYISIKPLEIVGKNAMSIYVTHILIVTACTFIVQYSELSKCYPYILWIYFAAYALLLPFICYVTPKVPILVGNTPNNE